jgi:hypothetical protein
MTAEFGIWLVGNLVLPIIPIGCSIFAQLVAGKRATVAAVLGDGVLFFYAVTTAAILMMDLWKDRIGEVPKAPPGEATWLISLSLVVMIFGSGAYFVTALARTGRLDQADQPFNLSHLSHLSWQMALAITIVSVGAHVWSGIS